jgi:hypothetical protein
MIEGTGIIVDGFKILVRCTSEDHSFAVAGGSLWT